MAAGLALAQPVEADRRLVGRYFPNDCSGQKGSYECFDPAYPLKARPLPTTPALSALRRRFGAAVDPILSEWLDLWRAAVGDVDAFAASIRPRSAISPGAAATLIIVSSVYIPGPTSSCSGFCW